MAENYVPLGTIQLTQNAASVTFDNIPQSGYTDLKIVASIRTDGASANNYGYLDIAFNGSTANYSARRILGYATAVNSGSGTVFLTPQNTNAATSNTFSNMEITIPNYTSSNYKSISVDGVTENNSTAAESAFCTLEAGLWSSTSAITSLGFSVRSGYGSSILANSTFSLYGIAALGTTPTVAPKATGGNIVGNDGTYWYHSFLSSGTFTPQTSLTADYLVVAGGGGGGFDAGGGGGAGGYRYFTSQSFSATAYTVTVGAGGAGATTTVRGSNGSTSTFNSISSSGGGGGGSDGVATGNSGGSGGGGRANGNAGGSGNAGSYSPVEGYAGGNAANPGAGGGGGGSSAVGQNSTTTTNGGNGGAATSNSITGSAVNYAGGGGGAVNQSTGGGAGADASGAGTGGTNVRGAGTAATANLGGGGGGGGAGLSGGAGGSGIVIIRYPMAQRRIDNVTLGRNRREQHSSPCTRWQQQRAR